MRCQACHAHLSIEDEKCPYCGTPNPEAIRHRQDMQRFSGEFQRTKSSVLKTSSAAAQKYVRIIIICILIVLLFASIFLMANSWNIADAIQQSKANSQRHELYELLDDYEANDDVLSFAALYEEKRLYSSAQFDQYDYYYRVASNYQTIYYDMLELIGEEQWEGQHEKTLEYLCDSIEYYYEYLEQEHYDFYQDTGMYDEVHLEAGERLTAKLEALLQMHFSLSDEDMESFRDLSNAAKQILIERSLADNE